MEIKWSSVSISVRHFYQSLKDFLVILVPSTKVDVFFKTRTPKRYGQPHRQHRSPLTYYFPLVWPKGQTKSGLPFRSWAIILTLGNGFSLATFLMHLFLSVFVYSPCPQEVSKSSINFDQVRQRRRGLTGIKYLQVS